MAVETYNLDQFCGSHPTTTCRSEIELTGKLRSIAPASAVPDVGFSAAAVEEHRKE